MHINVDPTPVRDGVPPDGEIREAVREGLKRGRAGGASGMRAEDLKRWLRGAMEEEDPESEGREGAGDTWRLFVRMVQSIWQTGTIPRQLRWIIIVLLPKGGGDYRGIGLLEPIWKVFEGHVCRSFFASLGRGSRVGSCLGGVLEAACVTG